MVNHIVCAATSASTDGYLLLESRSILTINQTNALMDKTKHQLLLRTLTVHLSINTVIVADNIG